MMISQVHLSEEPGPSNAKICNEVDDHLDDVMVLICSGHESVGFVAKSEPSGSSSLKRKLNFCGRDTSGSKVRKVSLSSLFSAIPSEGAPTLNEETALTTNSVLENNLANKATWSHAGKTPVRFEFLFFLDAQGKEQISLLREMVLQFPYISGMFVSLNIDVSAYETNPRISFLDCKKCKKLSREMGLLDPLGGGSYPINYLIILDSLKTIKSGMPLKFGHSYAPYQRFGLYLPQLYGIMAEYSAYANMQ